MGAALGAPASPEGWTIRDTGVSLVVADAGGRGGGRLCLDVVALFPRRWAECTRLSTVRTGWAGTDGTLVADADSSRSGAS